MSKKIKRYKRRLQTYRTKIGQPEKGHVASRSSLPRIKKPKCVTAHKRPKVKGR